MGVGLVPGRSSPPQVIRNIFTTADGSGKMAAAVEAGGVDATAASVPFWVGAV